MPTYAFGFMRFNSIGVRRMCSLIGVVNHKAIDKMNGRLHERAASKSVEWMRGIVGAILTSVYF